MMKIAILYSGGLDSFIMYHMAKKENPDAEVVAVFYAHGQESEKAEIAALPDFVKVRRIDWLNVHNNARTKETDPFAGPIYIPGRNLAFATLVACQELPDEIWMGTMYDEDNQGATDKNEEFRSSAGKVLSYVLSPFIDGPVLIKFPFVEKKMFKKDSIRWALENGISKWELLDTTSCWHNETGKQCGQCKQCLKRTLAMACNGIQDDEYYVQPVLTFPEQQNRIYAYLDALLDNPNMDERVMAWMISTNLTNKNGVWKWPM
jgi:7-cyano-7-deazaguanine synthase in queuosine biosynthesis